MVHGIFFSLYDLDKKLYDIHLLLAPAPWGTPDILTLEINDETHERLGDFKEWKWETLGSVLRRVDAAGAKVVVFDAMIHGFVPGSGPTAPGAPPEQSDRPDLGLGETNVLFKYEAAPGRSQPGTRVAAFEESFLPGFPPVAEDIADTMRIRFAGSYGDLVLPPEEIIRSGNLGMDDGTLAPVGRDGRKRAVPLVRFYDGKPMFSLALLAAARYFDVPPESIRVRKRAIVLENARHPNGTVRDVVVSVNRDGDLWVRFFRFMHPLRYIYEGVDEVLDDTDEVLRKDVQGKIIYFNASRSYSDGHPTPFHIRLSTFDIRLIGLNTIVMEQGIFDPPPSAVFGLLFVVLLIYFLVTRVVGARGAVMAALLLLGGLLVGQHLVFRWASTFIEVFPSLLAVVYLAPAIIIVRARRTDDGLVPARGR
jgi:hypothetical protein